MWALYDVADLIYVWIVTINHVTQKRCAPAYVSSFALTSNLSCMWQNEVLFAQKSKQNNSAACCSL